MKSTINLKSDIEALHQLAETGSTKSILSVYLVTDASLALGRDVHAQFSSLISKLRGDVDEAERAPFSAAVARVQEYLDARPNSGRSVCIFSSPELNLFTAVPLPVRVASGTFWGSAPYLRPLRSVIDEFEPTLVVLINQERSRLFEMFLDDIDELPDIESWVRGHTRQAGGAWASRGDNWRGGGFGDTHSQQRHAEQVHRHIRRVLERIRITIADGPIERIVVGGTPDAVSALRHLAPRAIATRIRAEITADMEATSEQIRQTVRSEIEALERADEQQLVSRLMELHSSGMVAVGVQESLNAVNEQNAYVLLYPSDIELSGGMCVRCGVLVGGSQSITPEAHCSGCGGAIGAIPDLVDVLSSRVLDMGGRIEEVRAEPAEWLRSRGGLAVVRRYAIPSVADRTSATPAPA